MNITHPPDWKVSSIPKELDVTLIPKVSPSPSNLYRRIIQQPDNSVAIRRLASAGLHGHSSSRRTPFSRPLFESLVRRMPPADDAPAIVARTRRGGIVRKTMRLFLANVDGRVASIRHSRGTRFRNQHAYQPPFHALCGP